MRTKRTKGFIDEIAKDNNLRSEQVLEIVESFFRFTVDIMSEGNRKTMEFDQVRLMKWGVFKVKEGRKKFLQKINEKKNEEFNNLRK